MVRRKKSGSGLKSASNTATYWYPAADSSSIPCARVDGRTPASRRGAVLRAFQAPGGAPVLLLSLQAGGVGLNLTAACRVHLLDPWWNPSVEEQAADRVRRLTTHARSRRMRVPPPPCLPTHPAAHAPPLAPPRHTHTQTQVHRLGQTREVVVYRCVFVHVRVRCGARVRACGTEAACVPARPSPPLPFFEGMLCGTASRSGCTRCTSRRRT